MMNNIDWQSKINSRQSTNGQKFKFKAYIYLEFLQSEGLQALHKNKYSQAFYLTTDKSFKPFVIAITPRFKSVLSREEGDLYQLVVFQWINVKITCLQQFSVSCKGTRPLFVHKFHSSCDWKLWLILSEYKEENILVVDNQSSFDWTVDVGGFPNHVKQLCALLYAFYISNCSFTNPSLALKLAYL